MFPLVGRDSLFRDREFVAVASTAFARSQAYSTVLIALALYADLFGTTGVIEGLFGTVFALAQLAVVLPLGRAIDGGDAKRYLIAGLLINVVVFAGFTLVESAVHVILVRLLQGLGASLLWITGSAVVGEISPDGSRGRWLGTYNQVAAVSSLAGDVIGGYLLYAHGFRLTYVVLSGVTILAAALVYRYLRAAPGGTGGEDSPRLGAFRSLLGLPTLRALCTFRLAFSFGKMAVLLFLPIFARKEFGVTALAIGGILAGGKLTKAAFQGYMGDLTDRVGDRRRFVLVGALLYALGTAAIPLAVPVAAAVPTVSAGVAGFSMSVSGGVATLFLAYGVLGVADSIRLPASMALFVEEGERFDSVASSMSLRSVSWKAGQITGPLVVGLLKDAVSMAAGFLAAAAVIVVAAVAFHVMSIRGDWLGGPEPVPGD